MSAYVALLSSLVLFEVFALPCGEVRRVTLLGFAVAGEILSLDEAAERIASWRPSTHADARQPRRSRPSPPVITVEACEVEPVVEREEEARVVEVVLEDAAEAAPLEEEDIDEEPDDTSAREATLVIAPPEGRPSVDFGDGELVEIAPVQSSGDRNSETIEPAEELQHVAVARPCLACNGGTRKRRGGCIRCGGTGVRAWLDETEIGRAPPDTDAERMAVVRALADVLSELPEEAHAGVDTILGDVMAGAGMDVRERGARVMRDAIARIRGDTF